MMLEVLYLPLVFLGGVQGVEGAQVLSFACLWVYLTGVDPVLSGFQFAYHNKVFRIRAFKYYARGSVGERAGCAIFSSLIPGNST